MFEKIFNKETEKNPGIGNEGTPFHVVSEKGYVRITEFIIKYSIENNINLNSKESWDGWDGGFTGFHYACKRDHVKIVELLIKNSVECNINLKALSKPPTVTYSRYLL